MRKCVSHHHACDCREAMFKKVVLALKNLLDLYNGNDAQKFSGQYAKEATEILNKFEVVE